jgi:hypothetical protein
VYYLHAREGRTNLYFVDYDTDAVIQSSLRSQLKDDVTVITVAHRLQTIMDSDKIVSASLLIMYQDPVLTFDPRWYSMPVD